MTPWRLRQMTFATAAQSVSGEPAAEPVAAPHKPSPRARQAGRPLPAASSVPQRAGFPQQQSAAVHAGLISPHPACSAGRPPRLRVVAPQLGSAGHPPTQRRTTARGAPAPVQCWAAAPSRRAPLR